MLSAALALGLGCSSAAKPPERAAAPEAAGVDAAMRLVRSSQEKLAAQDYEGAASDLERAIAQEPSLAGLSAGDTLRRLKGLLADVDWSESPMRRMEYAKEAGEAGRAAHEAIVAYAEGRELQAVLLGSAASGVDPGRESYRVLLGALSQRADIPVAVEEVLPRAALVQLKLQRAEEAYFKKRYGEAARHCQEALWLDDRSAPLAWTRLGSARYATGEPEKAREAFARALELDPDNPEIRKFFAARKWTLPEEAINSQ